MSYDHSIPTSLVAAVSTYNFTKAFPSPGVAKAALLTLRDVLAAHPGFLTDESAGNCLFGLNIQNGRVTQGRPTITKKEGSRRLQIGLCHVGMDGHTLSDPYARLDIPLAIICAGAQRVRKFHIYQIRFNVGLETSLDYESCKPLMAGYIGITKRGLYERYKEHEAKARANSGSLLHTAWHALKANHPKAYPVLQLVGHSETLADAYAAEELAVASMTLAPRGLNAIPGGEAGIRELYKLGLLVKREKLPTAGERDRALADLERNTPAAHYRRAHIRRLSAERTTFVNGCWVAVKPAMEAA